MKRLLIPLLGVFLFVSACGQPAPPPTAETAPQSQPQNASTEAIIVTDAAEDETNPALPPNCISADPTQEDIDRALSYTGQLFESAEWQPSYTVTEYKVSAAWISETAVAFLEVLIFPCGYEEPDLDAYFSDESWDFVFGDYESYEFIDSCANDSGLRLYEFEAVSDGVDYDIRYWAGNDTATRVLTFMMVLPAGSIDEMDGYGYALFPRLPSCD